MITNTLEMNAIGNMSSWPRRMMRLGHVSFFGIALLNLAFVFTVDQLSTDGQVSMVTSWLFIAAAVLMPTICYLSAWRKSFRHLFFLPVLSLLGATVTLIHWGISV